MNTNDSNPLVDEDQIRAAVRFFDFDRDAFNRGVRERVERGNQKQSSVTRTNQHESENPRDLGGLLRVAASVVPFPMLSGSAAAQATAAQSTLAAVGGVKKALALIALPALSLLMIAVTAVSFYRIQKAQQSEKAVDADVEQSHEAVTHWWLQHGLIAGAVFVLALAASFYGWSSALPVLFIVSALAATSLVVKLGQAGLVDRSAVASYCIPVLAILGQMSQGFGMTNRTSLLDPMLVTVTCLAGAGILALFTSPDARKVGNSGFKRIWRIALVILCGGFILLGAKTLWPISTNSMVQYVEDFDPDLLGRWRTWEVTADWLIEQDVEFDRTEVRKRFLASIDGEKHRDYLLSTGVSTGLISPSEFIENEEFITTRKRLLDAHTVDYAIGSVHIAQYEIGILADAGNLSLSEKEHLAKRLMVTWNEIGKVVLNGNVLQDAEVITRLLVKLDQSPEFAKRQTDVHRWLSERQVTKGARHARLGGFVNYPSVQSGHPSATENAVRLMQHYGGSEKVDVLALRSFLRPKFDFGWLTHIEMMRAATLERLNQVPGISRPTIWDYLVRDRSLWFALILVGLCLYATIGAPNLSKPGEKTVE